MPKVADRMQQGILNFLFLARLIKDPDGFASDPAFQAGAANTPVLDGTVFYDGNSQGGILGGAVTAVSTEWTRAVLGVPGMNYSTLLQRSSTSPRTRRSSTRRTPTSSTASSASRCSRCCGTGPRRTATPRT